MDGEAASDSGASDVRIVPAAAGHRDAVVRLEQEEFGEIALRPSQFRYYRRSPHGIVLVASGPAEEARGHVVATVSHRGRTPALWIITLAVRRGERRRGLGRRLMEAVQEAGREAGATSVRLEVAADDLGAIRFYEELGYEAAGEVPDYYEEGRDALRMTLPLDERGS